MAYIDAPYQNEVLENKVESILSTSLDMTGFLTVDNSLTEAAGRKVTIHKYLANGVAETLDEGEGNTGAITIDYEPVTYTVKTIQATGSYSDEMAYADPYAVENLVEAVSDSITNSVTASVVGEFEKTANVIYSADFGFDNFVDALSTMPAAKEEENGIFCLINPAQKAAIRKKLGDMLKYSDATYARTAYLGSVAGIPIYVSKAVTEGEAIISDAKAVTMFTKAANVAQERIENTRLNKVYARKVCVIALTDDRHCVLLKSEAKAEG